MGSLVVCPTTLARPSFAPSLSWSYGTSGTGTRLNMPLLQFDPGLINLPYGLSHFSLIALVVRDGSPVEFVSELVCAESCQTKFTYCTVQCLDNGMNTGMTSELDLSII
jgi:hypothetical protein